MTKKKKGTKSASKKKRCRSVRRARPRRVRDRRNETREEARGDYGRGAGGSGVEGQLVRVSLRTRVVVGSCASACARARAPSPQTRRLTFWRSDGGISVAGGGMWMTDPARGAARHARGRGRNSRGRMDAPGRRYLRRRMLHLAAYGDSWRVSRSSEHRQHVSERCLPRGGPRWPPQRATGVRGASPRKTRGANGARAETQRTRARKQARRFGSEPARGEVCVARVPSGFCVYLTVGECTNQKSDRPLRAGNPADRVFTPVQTSTAA